MTSSDPPAAGPNGHDDLVRSLVNDATADAGTDGLSAALQRACRAAVARLPVTGVAVHLMTTESDAVAAQSDAEAGAVAELQFAANEGPARVAYRTHRPVLVPDLDVELGRWPGFAPSAAARGVRAVFSFPLHEGAASCGVLEMYADTVGPLATHDLALAAAFARVVTVAVLGGGAVSSDGSLASGPEDSLHARAPIHQAQGMVMVDLAVSLPEALTRMRARAFARDITLLELAHDILTGALTADSWTEGDTDPAPTRC